MRSAIRSASQFRVSAHPGQEKLLARLWLLAGLCIAACLLAAPAWAAGMVERWPLMSKALGEEREVIVYRPADHKPEETLPLVFALGGPLHLDPRVDLPALLDAAIPARLPRAVVVTVAGPSEAQRAAFGQFFREELRPQLEARHPGLSRSPGRLLMAYSSNATEALYLAIQEPELFDRVALQSPGWLIWDHARGFIRENFTAEVVERIRQMPAAAYPEIWFMWGDSDEEWESRSRTNGALVMMALQARGVAVRHGGIVPGRHALSLMRDTSIPALEWLLSPPPAKPASVGSR